jgi:hypothetical protein
MGLPYLTEMKARKFGRCGLGMCTPAKVGHDPQASPCTTPADSVPPPARPRWMANDYDRNGERTVLTISLLLLVTTSSHDTDDAHLDETC